MPLSLLSLLNALDLPVGWGTEGLFLWYPVLIYPELIGDFVVEKDLQICKRSTLLVNISIACKLFYASYY